MTHWSWSNNYGKVKRLYPHGDKTYFSLVDGQTDMNPKDDYYYVPTSHGNYAAMIDLLYMAADSRWTIYARTDESLDNDGYARVIYFVVDW